MKPRNCVASPGVLFVIVASIFNPLVAASDIFEGTLTANGDLKKSQLDREDILQLTTNILTYLKNKKEKNVS